MRNSWRTALAGLLVVLIAAAGMGSRPVSALDPGNPNDRIALTALKYEGAWGGQCWQFMKDVVREATGVEIGFDYRYGFLDAGAVEVTDLSQVRAGDVIQIALDSWTAPDADYGGLHTAIVLTNLGDGVFDVIDSNQNFDEMVRVRPGYKPFEAAERYGLQVHIYRIVPDGSVEVPEPRGNDYVRGEFLPTGATGTVNVPGECLNLRTGGGLGNTIVTCLPHGTRFTVTAESIVVGGRHWAKIVTDSGYEGWVATEYVVRDTIPATASDGGRPILMYRSFAPGLSAH